MTQIVRAAEVTRHSPMIFPLLLVGLTGCGGPTSPTSPSPVAGSGSLATFEVDPSVIGGQRARGMVSLNLPAPPGGAPITLIADNPSVIAPSSLVIPAGAAITEFEFATTPVAKTTEVTITARAGNSQRTASVSVRIDPRPVTPTASYTIGFSSLRDNRMPVATYDELGFTVSSVSGAWMAITTYGRPAPFIQFNSAAGGTTTGEIKISAGGAVFWLTSADFYSSTTKIPYVIEGLLGSETMFTLLDVLGNTFGNFAKVSNPQADTPVDVLRIRLSNPAAPCCSNPMGVDNIVLRR